MNNEDKSKIYGELMEHMDRAAAEMGADPLKMISFLTFIAYKDLMKGEEKPMPLVAVKDCDEGKPELLNITCYANEFHSVQEHLSKFLANKKN